MQNIIKDSPFSLKISQKFAPLFWFCILQIVPTCFAVSIGICLIPFLFHSISAINSSTQPPSTTRTETTSKPRIFREVHTDMKKEMHCSRFDNKCTSDCCINGRCVPSSRCLPPKAARGGRGGGGFGGGAGGSGSGSLPAWGIALIVVVPSLLVICRLVSFCCNECAECGEDTTPPVHYDNEAVEDRSDSLEPPPYSPEPAIISGFVPHTSMFAGRSRYHPGNPLDS
jgi:hypothetical protein